MGLRRKANSFVFRYLFLLISHSEAEFILLDLGICNCFLAWLGFNQQIPHRVEDPKTVVAFEEFCRDRLSHAEIVDILEGRSPLEAVVEDILLKMHIQAKCRALCMDALSHIRRKAFHIQQIERIAKIPVNEDNQEAFPLFYEVWAALDDREVPESFEVTKSIGKGEVDYPSWGDLGFQTPLTDFRMTGLLGLKCLHHVSTEFKARARQVLAATSNTDTWLPCAITSVNVTAWVMEDAKKDKLSVFLYKDYSATSQIFYTLHAFYFFSFVNYWNNSDAKTILDFKKVSEGFRDYIIIELEKITDAYISMKNYEEGYMNAILLDSISKL